MAMSVQGYTARHDRAKALQSLIPSCVKSHQCGPSRFLHHLHQESGNLPVTWGWSMLQPKVASLTQFKPSREKEKTPAIPSAAVATTTHLFPSQEHKSSAGWRCHPTLADWGTCCWPRTNNETRKPHSFEQKRLVTVHIGKHRHLSSEISCMLISSLKQHEQNAKNSVTRNKGKSLEDTFLHYHIWIYYAIK